MANFLFNSQVMQIETGAVNVEIEHVTFMLGFLP